MTIDPAVAERIRVLVLDVDGVLTNGQLVLGASGEELKFFSVRDGIGIKLAQFAGLEVVFLSARTSRIVAARAKMLGVVDVYQGVGRKLEVLEALAARRGASLDEIAYVGDDIVDIGPVSAVGLGVAVGDAAEDLKNVASHVTAAAGGAGAVRETVEAILRARGVWDAAVQGYLERANDHRGSRG